MRSLCRFIVPIEKCGVAALAFNKSGEKLAGAMIDNDHSVLVWDIKVAGGSLLAIAKGGTSYIFSMSFKTENVESFIKEFITCGAKHLKFWSLNQNNLTCNNALYEKEINNVFLSILVSLEDCIVGDYAGVLQIWKNETFASSNQLHNGPIDTLSSHINYFISGSRDGTIKFLDKSYTVLVSIALKDLLKESFSIEPRSVCLSFEGKNLLIGTVSGQIYDIENKDTKLSHLVKNARVKCLVEGPFSPNNKTNNETWGLTVLPDNERFITVGDDAILRIWSIPEKKMMSFIDLNIDLEGKRSQIDQQTLDISFNSRALTVDISPNSRYIAIGCRNGSVRILTLSGELINYSHNFSVCKDQISVVKFSPFSDKLAIGAHDSIVYIYSVPEFRKLFVMRKHTSYITQLDWSNNGMILQSNCAGQDLVYWDISIGKPCSNSATRFRDEPWSTWTCVYGWPVQNIWNNLYTGNDIGTVDRNNKRHPGNYNIVAIGDDYSTVKLFRYPVVGKEPHYLELKGHSSFISQVRWTKDDAHLISIGGEDNCIIVWNVKNI